MIRKKAAWIWSLIFLLALASPAFSQLNRGTMEGTVTDPSGAAVPQVKVAVTSVETGVTLPTVTNSAGYFRVVDLVPGRYKVRFDSSGFSPLDMTDVVVPAGNQTIRVDAQLKLGATRQAVEVSATVSLVQTAATDFSSDIGTKAIEEIPLPGRDLQQLVFLVPGVTPNGPPGTNFGFNSQFGAFPDPEHLQGTNVAVNGGQGGINAWFLDGNLNLSGSAESIIVNPSPDAVTEFQTITNGFSAEYGRSGGAVFNVVLKSGANQLHGDVYEYVRNSYFNARNPFTSISSTGQIIPQNQLRYNNFGGVLGGPVVIPHLYDGRNKTFFFFSWDESILHIMGSSTFTVPTPAMREGDFSEYPTTAQYGLWDPSTTVGPDSNGLFQRTAFGTPVPGNPYGADGCLNTSVEAGRAAGISTCNFATQLPTSAQSKVGMWFMNKFPLPNYLDPNSACPTANGGAYRICNNYLGAIGSSQDGANISLKVDHQWSEKNRFFGEWLFNPGKYNNYRLPWTGPTFPASSIGYGSALPFDFANQIIAFGNTYTVSPTLINEFRANFGRQYYSTHPEKAGYPDSVTGLSSVEQLLSSSGIPLSGGTPAPTFTVAGLQQFGPVAWTNNMDATESYTILDNVTKLLGKHTLRTGFVYRLSHLGTFQSTPTQLRFYNAGAADPTTGLGGGYGGLASFEMGNVLNGSSYATTSWSPYARWRYWGLYLQDDFRVTPNFTLNLGLRYDIFGAYKTRQHPDVRFCLTCANSFTGLPGMLQYEGDAGFPMNSDVVAPNWNDIGPRINFSWSPRGDRKTVIRGGYDIFYTNAYSSINSAANLVNQPGYAYDLFWRTSANPSQCASLSGPCVSWNLDSTGDKGLLTTPQFGSASPAKNREQQYGGYIEPTIKPNRDPMVQNWTLQVQRQLPGDVAVTIGYAGSHGTHLVGNSGHSYDYVSTANTLQYRNSLYSDAPISNYYSGQTAAALAQAYGSSSLPLNYLLLPNPFWPWIGVNNAFDGTNVYHALQTRVDKKYSHGLNFSVAYTWSKNMVNPYVGSLIYTVIDPIHQGGRSGYVGGLTGALVGQTYGTSYQNVDNVKEDKALAFNDMPQVLNITPTYELPFGKGRAFLNHKGPLDLLVGGWRLTGSFNAASGVPLQITGPCNAITCRPDLVGNASNVSGGQNQHHWINAAAFQPPFGADQSFWANPDTSDDRWWQWGTAGMRLPGLRSPGFWNVDASLGKEFHFTESKYLDFRWEVFNAFNHMNLGLPNTGYCLSPTSSGSTDLVHQSGCQFGQIFNIQNDPRTMEFALKFVW